MVDFVRGEEAEAYAGALVEIVSGARAEALVEVTERCAFGQVLSDEAVGVLVSARRSVVECTGVPRASRKRQTRSVLGETQARVGAVTKLCLKRLPAR